MEPFTRIPLDDAPPGVKQVVMLTGDAKPVAEAVAQELGVDVVKSELLPADKVTEVEALLAAKDEKNHFTGKFYQSKI